MLDVILGAGVALFLLVYMTYAPGDLERIFDKFFRVQVGDRRRAGTGLGLSICKGFVEAMGGSIVAENRTDGPGALFRVTLKAAPPEHVPDEP